MLWRLVKPKPIYQITIPEIPTEESVRIIKESLRTELGDDYKVVVLFDPRRTYIETKIVK